MYEVEKRKKEIKRDYEIKRDTALRGAEDRKLKLYEKYPRLKEIEEEINQVGISIMKKVLFKGLTKEAAKEECERKMSLLRVEKTKIYKENNIPENYLDPIFECTKCKDTGTLEDGSSCTCYKNQLLQDVYQLSNMNVLLEKQNFQKLDENIYSSKPNKNGKVQKDIMKENIEIAKVFIDNVDNKEEKNLLFFGPTGSGKTFLSSCIAKEVLDAGRTVIYTTISELIDLARNYNFGEIDREVSNRYELMSRCDLLIIDDLGTELTNKFVMVELYKLINNRLMNGKKMIISTNLSLDEIYSNYSGRIFYRMVEGYKLLEFVGPNLRVTKLD